MSLVACSILSVGEEHNEELYDLLPSLSDNDVYVYTDSKNEFNENQCIIKNKGEFNFNKKLYPLDKAFIEHDTVICLDTDITILNTESLKLTNLETGVYVSWLGKTQMYKNKKTSIYQLLQGVGDSELVRHVNSLTFFGANMDNLYFFDEFLFVVVIKDSKIKNKFIKTWKKIYKATLEDQPTDRHENKLKGACESLIISLVCDVCGIKIIDNNPALKNLFNSIRHTKKTQKPTNFI
jgi:hypothetical protein